MGRKEGQDGVDIYILFLRYACLFETIVARGGEPSSTGVFLPLGTRKSISENDTM